MADTPHKNPIRVMTGRLGALTTHARGHTNTAPASQAAFDRFENQVDPDGILPPAERRRRAEFARRAHLTRIAIKRWHGTGQ